ncbi:hypothetical protein NUM3379_07760 [Kineococcus sp. NUM-3379]
MARRPARNPGKRPARPAPRPVPAPQAPPEAPRASSVSVAVFLSVVGLLASLVLWPLGLVLGVAGVVVAGLALRRGEASRAGLLAALVVGAVAVLSCALGMYLYFSGS